MTSFHTLLRRALYLSSIGLCLAGAGFAFDLVRQDILLNQVLAQLTFYQDDEYLPSPESKQKVRDQLAELSHAGWVNPDVKVYEASFQSWQRYWAMSDEAFQASEAAVTFARRAMQSQLEAVVERPAHFWNAEMLVMYIDEYRTIMRDGAEDSLLEAQQAADRSMSGLLIARTPVLAGESVTDDGSQANRISENER